MENRVIRNFEIKELIATGGMAAIYKAVQVSLDRVVAVKILHGHLAQDKDFITRFEREAKAAANLKHENVVNIIDFGKADDIYFIAMEYVEGKSLKDLINSVKFMPHDIALMIAFELSQGLAHAHQKGVVHRDIKPANVLIGYDGSIKIADFGLAQAQDLTSITVTGAIVGTPAYMSPEQAGGKKVDHRSDLFSLGVVIYEMLTGIKPFNGSNYSSIIHEILTVIPPKPFEANPLLPKETSSIIERMLIKDPEHRQQNVSEISIEIQSYLRRLKIEVTRKDIGEFIRAPNEQFEVLLQKRKDKHFERGLYYMTLGDDKIDEATNEFDKILLLDPEDSQAIKYIADLKTRKARKEVKTPAAGKEVRQKEKTAKKIPLPLIMGGVAVAVILMIFGVIFLKPKKEPGPGAPTFGIARISSSPAGAEIFFDGQPMNMATPAVIDSVLEGEHRFELKKTGYMNYSGTVKITRGDTSVLDLKLMKAVTGQSFNSVVIRSTPSGAAVYMDNISLDKNTPCTVESVDVGIHKFKIMRPGFETVELEREVAVGKPLQLSVSLTAIVKKVEGTAYLKVTVVPWAKIFIDDRYIETTPVAGNIKVAAGQHVVKLENPDYKIWQKRYDFDPDQTIKIDVQLEKMEGQLKLIVKPWADVYIDGKFYEATPIANPIKLSAGTHIIKLVNTSYKVYEESIDIPANKMLRKTVELVPK